MKKLTVLLQLLLTILFVSSCDRSDSDSGSGHFSISKTGGETFKTNYVTIPLPTKAGTFSVQYNKDYDYENLSFLCLIDNNNDCDLTITSDSPIKIGTYTESDAYLGGSLSNTNINYSKLRVNITSFSYPGKITGTFTAYNATNSIVYSGDFDLTAK